MPDFLTVDLICLLAGPLIAALVQMAKALAFVAQYPKIVAALLAVATGAVSGMTLGALDWMAIAECTIIPFAAAVATYEVVKTSAT